MNDETLFYVDTRGEEPTIHKIGFGYIYFVQSFFSTRIDHMNVREKGHC